MEILNRRHGMSRTAVNVKEREFEISTFLISNSRFIMRIY